jgi:hypothetical protein
MIDGMWLDWDDPGVGRRESGKKQSRAYLCAEKNVGLQSGREQRLPVLATESMFNRYFQHSPSWVATFSLHMITRANNLCLLAGAAEQRLFPRPYRSNTRGSIAEY